MCNVSNDINVCMKCVILMNNINVLILIILLLMILCDIIINDIVW